MSFIEVFFIAAGLSMDAFAVSVCKGLSVKKAGIFHIIAAGLYFGAFQAAMPIAGYFLGSRFSAVIERADHWIVAGLLALIGANMIYGARKDCDEEIDSSFGIKSMLPLAIATSVDALAVGTTFAFLEVENIYAIALFIGAITFIFSGAGIKAGNIFGARYKSGAEIVGGIILIIIGVKILLEHTGIIG